MVVQLALASGAAIHPPFTSLCTANLHGGGGGRDRLVAGSERAGEGDHHPMIVGYLGLGFVRAHGTLIHGLADFCSV
jgi:hypothetical protein